VAKRIALGKEVLGDGLVDDGDFEAVFRVGRRDGAPGNDGNSRRLKILAGDPIEHGVHVFFGCRRVAGEFQTGSPGGVADGRGGRECCGTDAGERGNALDQLLVKGCDLAGLISGELRVEFGNQQVGALEAVVLILQVAEGAQEETVSDQQEQGEHHLRGDQRLGPEVRGFAAATLRRAGA
jgi:hypothetical protein